MSGGPYTEDISPFTEENNIELTFNNAGVYSVCLDLVDNGCATWAGNLCRTVTITNAEVELFDTISVCEDMISDFDVTILNDQDPNGNGIFGWTDSDFEFTFGENLSITSDSIFCAFEQHLFITQIDNPEISLNPNADSLCIGDTLKFGLVTNGDYDNVTLTINSITQTDSLGILFPEVGEQHIIATISNACGISTDEATIQVLDTISSPEVLCDTSNVGSIILSWPEVDDVQGYWLSINGGSSVVLTDSFYVIEDLGSGEVVNVEFNVLDSKKCVGSSSMFTCVAQTIVGVQEFETNDIRIIPNPAFGHITIDGEIALTNASFLIYSIDGELQLSGDLDATNKINVLNLSPGLYVIALHESEGEIKRIGQFVKMK